MDKERLDSIIENINAKNLVNSIIGNGMTKLDYDILEIIDYVQVLQQRVDKAIKYIENIQRVDNYLDGVPCKKLLSFLEEKYTK